MSGNSKRSCYELGKRYGESLCYDFSRVYNIDIRVARIFNTYGPNLLPNDGRAISNFICQSLENRPITIYGDGEQTRSFCYIDDLIEGMLTLMESNYSYPMNLGSEEELKISELGKIITQKINPKNKIINLPCNYDEPLRRRPDISLAKKELYWSPRTLLDDGLNETIAYFKKYLNL